MYYNQNTTYVQIFQTAGIRFKCSFSFLYSCAAETHIDFIR